MTTCYGCITQIGSVQGGVRLGSHISGLVNFYTVDEGLLLVYKGY